PWPDPEIDETKFRLIVVRSHAHTLFLAVRGDRNVHCYSKYAAPRRAALRVRRSLVHDIGDGGDLGCRLLRQVSEVATHQGATARRSSTECTRTAAGRAGIS